LQGEEHSRFCNKKPAIMLIISTVTAYKRLMRHAQTRAMGLLTIVNKLHANDPNACLNTVLTSDRGYTV
jgi:hypothetical protein